MMFHSKIAPGFPPGNYSADEHVAEVLIRKNAFYLGSAALVIHGAGFWFKASG